MPNDVSADTWRNILQKALLSRFIEEEFLSLFSSGLLNGTVHTCIGQEFTGSVISEFLHEQDTIFSNHRCHGHFIARHDDIEGLVAELMGRETGTCGGLGGSQHLCKDGFYSNGIQGGIVPVAAGLALGHKLAGNGAISVVFIGDGTLGEGVVYETMNIAAKWDLPLLIVCEDNKYSQSTAQAETLAGSIPQRAQAFGIEVASVDTWDWQHFHRIAGETIGKVRETSRPMFMLVDTYRLKAHSKGDDLRPRDVLEPFEERDPLNRYLADLPGGDAEWVESLRQRIRLAVEAAQSAGHASLPPVESPQAATGWAPAEPMQPGRVVTALNRCLDEAMARDEKVCLLGEDILSPYGGAFKVTKGLSDRYPERVWNTPISEAAIVGIGTGLGLCGYQPMVEIMFGDFAGLAFDQIVNHAAKFHQMYNGQAGANVIVRTPMGAGRGYGPTHSQTLDRHFLGVPGLRVLAMNSLTAPEHLYGPLLGSETGPAFVIENKLLYTSFLAEGAPPGFELLHSGETFRTAWLRPQAARTDVTLLGYGGTGEMLLEACERLFEEHDLIAQVVLPMQIFPFSVASIADCLSAAPNLLIVEEGQKFAGFGAEVLSQMAELGLLGDMRARRLAPPEFCIPSAGHLEKEYLPNADSVVQAALALMGQA